MIPLFSFSPKVNFIQHASSDWILKVSINNYTIFVSCELFKWVASSLYVHIAFEQYNAVSHNLFCFFEIIFECVFPQYNHFILCESQTESKYSEKYTFHQASMLQFFLDVQMAQSALLLQKLWWISQFFLHLNAQCTKAAEVTCCVSPNYNPVYHHREDLQMNISLSTLFIFTKNMSS